MIGICHQRAQLGGVLGTVGWPVASKRPWPAVHFPGTSAGRTGLVEWHCVEEKVNMRAGQDFRVLESLVFYDILVLGVDGDVVDAREFLAGGMTSGGGSGSDSAF